MKKTGDEQEDKKQELENQQESWGRGRDVRDGGGNKGGIKIKSRRRKLSRRRRRSRGGVGGGEKKGEKEDGRSGEGEDRGGKSDHTKTKTTATAIELIFVVKGGEDAIVHEEGISRVLRTMKKEQRNEKK